MTTNRLREVDGESSNELARETIRREGPRAKQTCSRCDDFRVMGSAYCQRHKNEYQREWARKQAADARAFRAARARGEVGA